MLWNKARQSTQIEQKKQHHGIQKHKDRRCAKLVNIRSTLKRHDIKTYAEAKYQGHNTHRKQH